MEINEASRSTYATNFNVSGIPAGMSDYTLEGEVARMSRLAFIFDVKILAREGSTAVVSVITD